MTRVSVVSVNMAVKKTDTGDAGLFYLLFYTVYCNENRLKNNMTPYEPRHEKTCLGTDHLIFFGGGGSELGFFLKPKYFFQVNAKTKYIYIFFLNSIYARSVFF